MENKYEVVKALLKEQLTLGNLKPGEKLPSIRSATRLWDCSKNTVIRAYQELEKEHLIYSVPKSGYYAVLRPRHASGASTEWVDFTSASPDAEVMPYKDFQHCLNRAIELYEDQLFAYSDPQGFFTLRRALEKHLAHFQIFAPPAQICVVSGAQQALHLLAAMPFPNGKSVVLVEQPTFHGMLRSLELLGVKALGIERTMEGIDFDELERHFRNNHIKFFYTVPRFHNPLGASYTEEQKKHLVRLAAQYDVYIVEDDFLADMDANAKADPIYSYDQADKVIYVKSFSKIMLPGLRLASVVLPASLLETFRQFKASCDSSTAALSQAALELYLPEQRHVRPSRCARAREIPPADAKARRMRQQLAAARSQPASAGRGNLRDGGDTGGDPAGRPDYGLAHAAGTGRLDRAPLLASVSPGQGAAVQHHPDGPCQNRKRNAHRG